MGYSVLYQAISEQAQLFERLRKDRKIYLLFQAVLPYSCDIFYTSEVYKIYKSDLDDILDGMVEARLFISRVEAEKLWNEFLAELEGAKSLYPGIADRAARLGKGEDIVGKALMLEIERMGLNIDTTLEEYVYQFIRGSKPLKAKLSYYSSDEIYLVPSSLVKEFADILRQIEFGKLFEKSDLYYQENFERWKNLYLEASSHDEALLVNVI